MKTLALSALAIGWAACSVAAQSCGSGGSCSSYFTETDTYTVQTGSGQTGCTASTCTTGCEAGSQAITDAATCWTAVQAIGYSTGQSGPLQVSSSPRPEGCVVALGCSDGSNAECRSSVRVLFYENGEGGAGSWAAVGSQFFAGIVCQPGPTESPTPVPTASPTPPTASPTFGPTLSGDPHLVGLRGQKFDLLGKPNTAYNLIADDRLQVNILVDVPFFEHSADAKLRASGKHAGLFMTGVDVAYLDGDGLAHEVSVQGDYNSTVRGAEQHCGWRNIEKDKCLRGLQAQVDGDKITKVGAAAALQMQNVDCPFNQRDGSCKVKATNGGFGLAVLVTPSLTLEVGASFMNNHAVGQMTVHHLDLAVSDYRPSGKPGGLIGQTVDFRYDADGNPIMKGPGCIEGAEDDYIVSGLDFAKLQNTPVSEGDPLSASADGAAADGAKRE